MSDYEEIIASTVESLTEFGEPVTLTTTTGIWVTNSRTTVGLYTKTIKHSIPDAGYTSSANGVQIGDFEYLLAANAMPLITDKITIGASSFILMVPPEPIKYAGNVVAWTVWGRVG